MELENSVTKDLEVDLTPEEVLERQEQLARSVKELESTKEEQRKVQKHWSQKVGEIDTRVRRLATACTTHKENRPVLCYERPDLRRFMIEVVRKDNGAVVDTKQMTGDQLEEARQANLFGGVRVATTEKKLDLSSPQAQPAPAEIRPIDAEPSDESSITNPEGLLNGEQAKKAGKRTRKRRGEGMNVSTAKDIEKAHKEDAKADAASVAPRPDHWPDCALNHGGAACDMGEDCGQATVDNTDDPMKPPPESAVSPVSDETDAEESDVDDDDLVPEGGGQ